jgi:DNA-binding GntR family transcriptional regulator
VAKLGSEHENLDVKVYKTLKSIIFQRKLKPGEKIYQDKLAREFGVSRTPVVSALKKLEHDKLVVSIPRRGFYVRLFSREEMVQIFELREVLEGLAARRASVNISAGQIEKLRSFFNGWEPSGDAENVKRYADEDRRFHSFLVGLAGVELLSSILDSYNIITFSYQVHFQEGLVRPPEETIDEHRAIIEAISNRDPDTAERLMRRHLRLSGERLLEDVWSDGITPAGS